MFSSYNEDDMLHDIRDLSLQRISRVPVVKGDFTHLPKKIKQFVTHCVHVMSPRSIFICDGSKEEADEIIKRLVQRETFIKLGSYRNNYLIRSDPADVERVESKTFIVTSNKYDAVPHVKGGAEGILGRWMSHEDSKREMDDRFTHCMKGRMMYVIPFCMGPAGSPLCKPAIQVTDSNYVLLLMRIMTQVGGRALEMLHGVKDFVKAVHSMGCPRPVKRRVKNHWPCNPERIMLAHYPESLTIKSYGSLYGGNSLLGRKCFGLRLASVIARDEGWLAEHMLIMSVTTPQNKEYFIAAAFPSHCGKTNLAMMNPSLPGYKIKCVGDHLAWLRFNDQGIMHGINPETGFFGVAPGTNSRTNPNAMRTVEENCIFTNVGFTADGRFFWEGLEDEIDEDVAITSWRNQPWRRGESARAAQPNARFTVPAGQCPVIHPRWQDKEGVPISAILFGGRRPEGVPLVAEAKSWAHGVLMGACLKSGAEAAFGQKDKAMMADPMAMRAFVGYNFGHYLQHWLDMEQPGRTMPKIFHVNWFRQGQDGKPLWPGFGENIRVLDWILRRCEGDDGIVTKSPLGGLPKPGSIDLTGLPNINEAELFSAPKDFCLKDIEDSRHFFKEQMGEDTPRTLYKLLEKQEQEFHKI